MKVDKRELAKLVPHIVANVAQGASRCLRVVGPPIPYLSENAIRRDFERFGNVERVELTPSA
jgi:hypothetical protein